MSRVVDSRLFVDGFFMNVAYGRDELLHQNESTSVPRSSRLLLSAHSKEAQLHGLRRNNLL